MPHAQLDHIVIASPTLASGVEYVYRSLGVRMQPGGEHPRMGTHNALLKLGDALFLEVIAIDPGAPRPSRPRWFGLDNLAPDATPFLTTWVARTDDLRSAMSTAPSGLGDMEPMSRGSLNWQITIPQDGSLPLNGIAPTLIEWHNGPHPADKLEDRGCRLLKLEGFHPEAEEILSMLQRIGFEGQYFVYPLGAKQRPYLQAQIQTPDGIRVLRGG